MKLSFLVMAMVITLAGAAWATPDNFGFESGGFTSWSTNSTALTSVTTSASVYSGSGYGPAYGTYFAVATSGLGSDIPTVISQSFSLASGQILYGASLFDGQDYMPYNDYAYVDITWTGSSSRIWQSSISSVGIFGHTNWQNWAFTAPVADTYRIVYGVVNSLDNSGWSRAFFDGYAGAPAPIPDGYAGAPAPIPGALWLLGSGLLGLAGLRRRREN